MSLLGESDALHRRASAFVAAFEERRGAPESFDRLACDIARFQARAIPGFARLLKARSIDPEKLIDASQIPGVPTDAFKAARISVFAEDETPIVFRTSGTTVGTRGSHFFRTTETYDRGALAFGRMALATPPKDRLEQGTHALFALTPPPEEAFDSSLVHMLARFIETFGAKTDRSYFLERGALQTDAFVDALEKRSTIGPSIVLGTSFAFVHLLDALNGRKLSNLQVTLALHTGGTKGRTREIGLDEIEEGIASCFGLPRERCIAEYGMTELSSEFYRNAKFGSATSYFEPPWARIVPVDPISLIEVGESGTGIAKIIDVLNVDSAVSVLTQDLVRRDTTGFQLLGRARGATPRGCSLAVEEMLG